MDNKRFGKVLKVLVALLAAFAFSVIVSGSALAQAWLPPKGEGSVSLVYQRTDFGDHILSKSGANRNRVTKAVPTDDSGRRLSPGRAHMDGNSVALNIDYGIFTKLALNADLPYIDIKYLEGKGKSNHKGGNEEKLGYNRNFQDLHLNLRYLLLDTPLILTPFVELQMPTTNYETLAHSNIGNHLRAFLVGTYLGRRLNPFLPGGYIQGRYSYAFVEKVMGINLNRSDASLEIGYFPVRSLSLRAFWLYQNTHGGIGFPSDPKYKPEYDNIHDRISAQDVSQIGGGVSFSVNDSLAIFANYFMTTIALSAATHETKGIALGTNWGF